MPVQQETAAKLKRFGALARRDGASFYPEPCRPTEVPPQRAPMHKNLPPPERMSTAYTTGCGSAARVGIPYISGRTPARKAGELGECIVCAIDDRAYDFPRYGG